MTASGVIARSLYIPWVLCARVSTKSSCPGSADPRLSICCPGMVRRLGRPKQSASGRALEDLDPFSSIRASVDSGDLSAHRPGHETGPSPGSSAAFDGEAARKAIGNRWATVRRCFSQFERHRSSASVAQVHAARLGRYDVFVKGAPQNRKTIRRDIRLLYRLARFASVAGRVPSSASSRFGDRIHG